MVCDGNGRATRSRWATFAEVAFVIVFGACGPEVASDEPTIRFRTQALKCTAAEGLEARLEIGGVDELCILNVTSDRTVTGTCRIPAGQARAFRLVYLARVGDLEVELASITAVFDLTDPPPTGVELDFSGGHLESSAAGGFDIDGDEISNLEEFCNGTL